MDPINGSTVIWGDAIRLRHHPSTRYLVVTKYINYISFGSLSHLLNVLVTELLDDRKGDPKTNGYKCELTDNPRDPMAAFKFVPVIKEENKVKLESYTRIRHVETG